MKTLPLLTTGLTVAFVAAALHTGTARACLPLPSVMPFGLPLPTSSTISTATTIHIVAETQPTWVEVTAGGKLVKTDGVELVSGMHLPNERGKLWRVRGLNLSDTNSILQASSEYVVSMTYGGKRRELTRFTTASGYDKQQGTAPLLRAVKLWRVRYPAGLGGMCIYSEYHAFIELDYEPAAIPDTPSGSVIYTVRLWPKTGGQRQDWSFTGAHVFKGAPPKAPDYMPGAWPTDLDPSREYCVTITARGYGDLARLTLTSEEKCTQVTSLNYDGPRSGKETESGEGCALLPSRGRRHPWGLLALLLPLLVLRSVRRRGGRGARHRR